MKPFCETVVAEILPAVRSLLAGKLVKRGLKNKEVAALVGVTPAAVTQYLKKARGEKARGLMKNKKIDFLMERVADDMVAGMNPVEEMAAFCGLCQEVRRQHILCKAHKGPQGCRACVPLKC